MSIERNTRRGPRHSFLVSGGEQPAVFAFHKGLVKLEQGGRAYDNRVLGHACRCHEETGESEQKPIPSCEVGCSSTAAVENDELMFDQQRLREQSLAATRTDKLGDVDEQMHEKEESNSQRTTSLVCFLVLVILQNAQ